MLGAHIALVLLHLLNAYSMLHTLLELLKREAELLRLRLLLCYDILGLLFLLSLSHSHELFQDWLEGLLGI